MTCTSLTRMQQKSPPRGEREEEDKRSERNGQSENMDKNKTKIKSTCFVLLVHLHAAVCIASSRSHRGATCGATLARDLRQFNRDGLSEAWRHAAKGSARERDGGVPWASGAGLPAASAIHIGFKLTVQTEEQPRRANLKEGRSSRRNNIFFIFLCTPRGASSTWLGQRHHYHHYHRWQKARQRKKRQRPHRKQKRQQQQMQQQQQQPQQQLKRLNTSSPSSRSYRSPSGSSSSAPRCRRTSTGATCA